MFERLGITLSEPSKNYIEKKQKDAVKQKHKRASREFAIAQQKRNRIKKEDREKRKLDLDDGVTGTL